MNPRPGDRAVLASTPPSVSPYAVGDPVTVSGYAAPSLEASLAGVLRPEERVVIINGEHGRKTVATRHLVVVPSDDLDSWAAATGLDSLAEVIADALSRNDPPRVEIDPEPATPDGDTLVGDPDSTWNAWLAASRATAETSGETVFETYPDSDGDRAVFVYSDDRLLVRSTYCGAEITPRDYAHLRRILDHLDPQPPTPAAPASPRPLPFWVRTFQAWGRWAR